MSYQHAIVPLDGSALAECVLSYLEDLASGSQITQVELVRAVPPLEMHYKAALPIGTKEEQALNQAAVKEAEEYLQKVKARLEARNLKVTTKVLTGNVGEVLTDYLNKSGSDLLLLATHGRSGPSRWVWGSVAEKILHSANMPIFLVRPTSCKLVL